MVRSLLDAARMKSVIAVSLLAACAAEPSLSTLAQLESSAVDDVVFTSGEGELALWSLERGWRVIASTGEDGVPRHAADVDGDGVTDLVFEQSDGTVTVVLREAGSGMATGRRQYEPLWIENRVDRVVDLDGDGARELVWVGNGGAEVTSVVHDQTVVVKKSLGAEWALIAAADLDGDGRADLVWRSGDRVQVWSMDGASVTAERAMRASAAWTFVDAGDVDGDGRADLVWRETSGMLHVWFAGDPRSAQATAFEPALRIEAVQDLDGDGLADLLVRDDAKGTSHVYARTSIQWTYTNGGVTHEDVWSAQT
jgi:hypothetical protein